MAIVNIKDNIIESLRNNYGDIFDAINTIIGTPQVVRKSVTVTTVAHCSVTLSPEQPQGGYISGTVVTATATPDSGYVFSGWSGGVAANPYSFVVTSDVTLTPQIDAQSGLVVTVSATNGTVSGAGTFRYGDVCTLVFTPNVHHHLTSSTWGSIPSGGVVSADNTTLTFIVTASTQVTATATIDQHTIEFVCETGGTITVNGQAVTRQEFTENYGTTYEVIANPDTQNHYHFYGWSDDGAQTHTVTFDRNKTVTASFARDTVRLNFVGVNCTVSPSGYYTTDYGDTVTVTATPNTHYHWTARSGREETSGSWSDGGAQTHTITATGNDTYTATCAIDKQLVEVRCEANGTVVADGSTIQPNHSIEFKKEYGSTIHVVATPATDHHFYGWSDGGAQTHDITVDRDKTVTAQFDTDTVRLNFSGVNCTVSPSGYYTTDVGDSISISATPNTGYHWGTWSDGGAQTHTIIASASTTQYTATCLINTYTIAAPSVTGCTVTGSGTYNYGQTCVLTATLSSGYEFASNPWSGLPSGATVSADYSRVSFVVNANVSNISCTATKIVCTVTCYDSNGTVTGAGTYYFGDSVTMEFTPDTGYAFSSWLDNQRVFVSSDNPYTFTITSNVILRCSGVQLSYTVSCTPTNGTVSGIGPYHYGDSVSLVFTPSTHYEVTSDPWGNKPTGATVSADYKTLTFSMPANNVSGITVTGTAKYYTIEFSAEGYGSVTGTISGTAVTSPVIRQYGTANLILTATADSHYNFYGWSDSVAVENPHSVVFDGNKTVTGEFRSDVVTLRFEGTNCTLSPSGSYTTDYGDDVTVTVYPSSHYHFSSWTDGNTDNPRTINATSSTTYTATCVLDTFMLTLGGDAHCITSGIGTYNYNTQVSASASVDTGYHFVNWTNGQGGTAVSASNPYTFNIQSNTTLYANSAVNYYTVSASTTNGTVSGAGSKAYGSECILTVIPSTHYHFVRWSDGNTSNPRTVTVTGNTSYSAVCAIDTFTISATMTNGMVSGGGTYDYGSTCTLTAHPNTGYGFTKWQDDIVTNPRSFTVTGNATYSGTCSILKYTFNPTFTPTGSATITAVYYGTSTPVTIGSQVDYGSKITTTVTPASGYKFISWSDGVTTATRTDTITGGHFNVIASLGAMYNISAVCNPTSAGTAKVAGAVHPYTDPYVAAAGESVVVRVMPKIGYTFKQWVKGSEVVSTAQSFTITASEDANYVAQFEVESES